MEMCETITSEMYPKFSIDLCPYIEEFSIDDCINCESHKTDSSRHSNHCNIHPNKQPCDTMEKLVEANGNMWMTIQAYETWFLNERTLRMYHTCKAIIKKLPKEDLQHRDFIIQNAQNGCTI